MLRYSIIELLKQLMNFGMIKNGATDLKLHRGCELDEN